MDGVVCDFTKSVFKIINKQNLIGNWPVDAKNMAEATGHSYAEIWGEVDKLGESFWRNLEEFDYFSKMHKELKKLADVCFLTSPSLSHFAASGKVLWLQDRFGKRFRDYIITSHKHYCANENTLLIDDTHEKVDLFKEHGGEIILFPQPWNSNAHIENKLDYVLDRAKTWAIAG
jgi:5'(3')-deoxyribonucleotidase